MKRMLKPQFQKNIYPDSVIMLRGTEEMIQNIVGKLPNELIQKSHWMAVDLDRRLRIYNDTNSIDNYLASANGVGQYPTSRFFQENKTEIFELDCNGENFEMFESMRIYIERDGRPYNYLSSIDELNQKRDEHLKVEETDWRENIR